MKYFLFTKLNINHFFFLLYYIIHTVRTLINKQYNITEDICASFHKYYIYSLSDFLSIIPIIIIKIRSKSSKSKGENERIIQEGSAKEKLIYVDAEFSNTKRKAKKIIILLIIISFLDFLAHYSNVIFLIIIKKGNYQMKSINFNFVLIIHIVSQYLFNRIILNYRFYKHHCLSLFINLIFLIILGIMDIIQINKADNDAITSFFYLLTKILYILFYSSEDAFAKIILTHNSISPYIFLFFRGILVNLFALIFSVIFIYVDLPDENGENSCVFTRFWKLYEKKANIIIYIGISILNFLYNVDIFFLVDKFSPSHLAVTSVLGHFSSILDSAIIYHNIEVSEFFLRFIVYIFLIFGASIHNELIVLNFCKLQVQTKMFLEREAERDMSQTVIDIGINEQEDKANIDDENSDTMTSESKE